MTEVPGDGSDSDKENIDGSAALPDAVYDKTREIIGGVSLVNVDTSEVITLDNDMWDLVIHFKNGTTRRVRVGVDGTVISDTTTQTNPLRERK